MHHNVAYRIVYQELSDLFDHVTSRQEQIDLLKQNKHLRYIQQQLSSKTRDQQLNALLTILNNKFQLAISINEDLHQHESSSVLSLTLHALSNKLQLVKDFLDKHGYIIASTTATATPQQVVYYTTLAMRLLSSIADQHLIVVSFDEEYQKRATTFQFCDSESVASASVASASPQNVISINTKRL